MTAGLLTMVALLALLAAVSAPAGSPMRAPDGQLAVNTAPLMRSKAPIFVPMLMQVGLAPELTQAAYRVGDSSTNIITPLTPYFPLVVVCCQRYVRHAGIGTLASMMLPYSVTFLVVWTLYLLTYWWLGIPLGLQSVYTHP